jgi:hypothetical protein
MDVEETIQVRSFKLDLFEALKTVAKICSQTPTVLQFCERFLRLDVRMEPPLSHL